MCLIKYGWYTRYSQIPCQKVPFILSYTHMTFEMLIRSLVVFFLFEIIEIKVMHSRLVQRLHKEVTICFDFNGRIKHFFLEHLIYPFSDHFVQTKY